MTMEQLLALGAPKLGDPDLFYRVLSDADGKVEVQIRRDRDDRFSNWMYALGCHKLFQSRLVTSRFAFPRYDFPDAEADLVVTKLAIEAAENYVKIAERAKLDFWGNLRKLEGDHH